MMTFSSSVPPLPPVLPPVFPPVLPPVLPPELPPVSPPGTRMIYDVSSVLWKFNSEMELICVASVVNPTTPNAAKSEETGREANFPAMSANLDCDFLDSSVPSSALSAIPQSITTD